LTATEPGDGQRPIEVELRVGKLVGGGRALAHHDGDTWLVAGALPGELARVRITGRRAGVVEAHAIEVLDDHHAARTVNPCPHADRCGGCDWPFVQPDAGASLKAAAAAEAFRGHPELAARLRRAAVKPSPLGYRLRARLHWDPASRTLGFYERRSWVTTSITSCRVISARLAEAMEALSGALQSRCPEPVDVEWLEDLDGGRAVAGLRPARQGPTAVESEWLPASEELQGLLDGCHLLSRTGRRLLGWGEDGVVMRLPICLFVPIGSFFQGNSHLARWLFERTAEMIGTRPTPTWDLHAGVGFLAAAAQHAAPRPLQLVEPFRPSARAARRNLPTARVAVGRTSETYLDGARGLPRDALVLVDPPRSGLTPKLRRRLSEWHPDRILMLACDPATWARDTAFLLERGYRLDQLELVDLFPSTHHVEVLALLVA
jgi:23S rRNA (uracil1939-C5)-methyltransferase